MTLSYLVVMNKTALISIFVLIAALVISGCITTQKKEINPLPVQPPSQPVVTSPAPTPVPTPTPTLPKPPVKETVKDPAVQVQEYLQAHPVPEFLNIDERIIEVVQEGNKSVLRFRTSTPNPRQESLYLLGVQFIVFPDYKLANVTGYNEEGKIIQAPDSRTESTKSLYWKKYRTKSDWFPNLQLQAECITDKDCDDNNDCTKDLCTSDGFCSNAKVIKGGCVA